MFAALRRSSSTRSATKTDDQLVTVNGVPVPDTVLLLILDFCDIGLIHGSLVMVCRQFRDACMHPRFFSQWSVELNPLRFHPHYHRFRFDRIAMEQHLLVIRHPLTILDDQIQSLCSIPWKQFPKMNLYLDSQLKIPNDMGGDHTSSASPKKNYVHCDLDMKKINAMRDYLKENSKPLSSSSSDSSSSAAVTAAASSSSSSSETTTMMSISDDMISKHNGDLRFPTLTQENRRKGIDPFYVPFGDLKVMTNIMLPLFISLNLTPCSRRASDNIIWYESLFNQGCDQLLHLSVNGKLVHRQFWDPPKPPESIDWRRMMEEEHRLLKGEDHKDEEDTITEHPTSEEEIKMEAEDHDADGEEEETKQEDLGSADTATAAKSTGVILMEDDDEEEEETKEKEDSPEEEEKWEYPGLTRLFCNLDWKSLVYLEFNQTSFPETDWLSGVCLNLPRLIILDLWRCDWKKGSVVSLPPNIEILRMFGCSHNHSQLDLSFAMSKLRVMCLDSREITHGRTLFRESSDDHRSGLAVSSTASASATAATADSSVSFDSRRTSLSSKIHLVIPHLSSDDCEECISKVSDFGFTKDRGFTVYVPFTDDMIDFERTLSCLSEAEIEQKIAEEIVRLKKAGMDEVESSDDEVKDEQSEEIIRDGARMKGSLLDVDSPEVLYAVREKVVSAAGVSTGFRWSEQSPRLMELRSLQKVKVAHTLLPREVFASSDNFKVFRKLRKAGILRGTLSWE